MFEAYINKQVKLVVNDNGSIKAYRGLFLSVEGTADNCMITLTLDSGRLFSVKLTYIEKITERDD